MYRIMRRINIVSRCQSAYLAEQLKELGLCSGLHSYILAITRRPGVSQEELAKELGVNKSNVTRNLASLEEKGYVERHSSPQDRRVMQVFPTEQMQAVSQQVREAAWRWNDYLTTDFTEEEMEQFQRVLDRLVEKAKQYMERGDVRPL